MNNTQRVFLSVKERISEFLTQKSYHGHASGIELKAGELDNEFQVSVSKPL